MVCVGSTSHGGEFRAGTEPLRWLAVGVLCGSLLGAVAHDAFRGRELPSNDALVANAGDLALPSRRLSQQESDVIQLFSRATPSVVFVTTYGDRGPLSMNTLEVPLGNGSG